MHRRAILTLALLMAMTSPSGANEETMRRLVGTWRLTSFVVENVDTGERNAIFGERPNGYFVVTPEGRLIALLTAQGRPVPQADEQRVAAFRTMFAYSGPVTVEANRLSTRVELSWNEAWTGTDQVRFFHFEGEDRLVVETAPAPGPNTGMRMARGILAFERAR